MAYLDYNPLVWDEAQGIFVENVPPRFPVVPLIVISAVLWYAIYMVAATIKHG